MHLNLAIVDDLLIDRDHLSNEINQYFSDRADVSFALDSYSGGEELLDHFESGSLQIVMLDICMDGMNGIELAKRLRAMDTKLLIIFLTTSREYAFDAFPIHPFDYIIKPYSRAKIRLVLDEALRTLMTKEPEITLRVAHGILNVSVSHIVSAVSAGHSVEVHTVGGQTLRCLMTFTDIRTNLEKYPCFMLCNRGIYINMDHALSLKKDEIIMDDGSRYTLRIKKRTELITRFSQYQLSRVKGGYSL